MGRKIDAITTSGEVVNRISAEPDGATYIIGPDHSIADIARWLIENNWEEEVEYFLIQARHSEQLTSKRSVPKSISGLYLFCVGCRITFTVKQKT